jgi:hypothetical protein
MLHVDVEGNELNVLKGAINIIQNDKPVITFEQHISQEDVNEVFNYLKNFDYKIFMINEVLPFCDKDCRNFIAFHKSKNFIKNISKINNFEQKNSKNLGINSATVGSSLIEL